MKCHSVPSSFAITLIGKRELVALLSLSSWCFMTAVWLFLKVPWVCLQFVIVVFPDHTHLLLLDIFFTIENPKSKSTKRSKYKNRENMPPSNISVLQ